MKLNKPLFLGMIFTITACGSKKLALWDVNDLMRSDTLCFQSVRGETKAVTQIIINTGRVKGSLSFNFKGGYIRNGMLDGEIKRDTLRINWEYYVGDRKEYDHFTFLLDRQFERLLILNTTYHPLSDSTNMVFTKLACADVKSF